MQFKKAILLSMMISCSAIAASNASVKFPLNNKTLDTLKARISSAHNSDALINSSVLPSEKQLGMNHLPVMDQGELYDDAIFASTAAVDAAMGNNDIISQNCLIQLANYMRQRDQAKLLKTALSQLENYGFIVKKRQSRAGCDDPNGFINFENYHRFSKSMMGSAILWTPILDFSKAVNERTDTGKTLEEIQKSLSNGHRATMSFLVPSDSVDPFDPTATHHVKNDTWVLTSQIERSLYSDVGNMYLHSIIITGYDNEAVTVDNEGKAHKGLLTLRGSWGQDVGDKGDFYMSYDYFRVLVLEAQQVIRAE